MKSSKRAIFAVSRVAVAGLLVAGAAAQAQTAPVADGLWHGSVSIGGAAAGGNTNSTVVTGAADAVKTTAQDKITFYGLSNYVSSKKKDVKTTSANNLRLGGRYDYNLSERTFAFGMLEGETNKVASLKSRISGDVGLGYHVIRTPETTFDVFGGVGATQVKFVDDSSRSGATLLLGEESSHKLSASTSFKQRLVVRPGRKDLGTTATWDAGLATSIVGSWTLNTGLSVRYASEVPVGVKSTDTLWTVGFGYKF